MRTAKRGAAGGRRRSRVERTAASALLAALLLAAALPFPAGAQSVIPVVEMTIEPLTQEVDASSQEVSALYNCSVFVEGLPYVRYRVNLTADCEGWAATCDPGLFTVTGTATNSFSTRVLVPSGWPGGDTRQLNLTAVVSTTGVPLSTCVTYAVLNTKQSYGVKLLSDTSSLTVSAGQSASWSFGVKNLGNGRDSISVSVVDLQSYTKPGWSVKFNRSIISVDVGATAYATINITPVNTSKNQTVDFKINAYSRGARFENITVEDILALQLTVVEVPPGTKPPTPVKPTPGAGLALILSAMALAATVALRSRKRR